MKEVSKLVGVIIGLGLLIWIWYSLFPSYANFSWYFAVVVLVSVLDKDFKFFGKDKSEPK